VPPLAERFEAQPGDSVTYLSPGAVHIRRVTDDPLRINLLLFDLTAPAFDLAVGLGDGWLSGRQRPSFIAEQAGALAAVNGDLFGPEGIPQGLTVIDGKVVTAPKRRATFAFGHDNTPFIGYFTEEWTWRAEVRAGQERAPVTLLNSACPPEQICLFNEYARSVPARIGDVKVLIDAGGRVVEQLREVRVRVPVGMRVLQGTGAGARWLRANAVVGARLRVTTETEPPLSTVAHAISGGPILLRGGAFVEDCFCALRDCSATATPQARLICEDFTTDWKLKHYDYVRMPRTGIGYDAARQTLIVAVVDGYQRGYSRGATQAEFAALLSEFGADSAMELDGGGSSTMWLDGAVINRPPDNSGERYVANALLFFWRDDQDGPGGASFGR
jgi:hypothetical protein